VNKGLISGVTPGVWQRYRPRMICVGGTDPTTTDAGDIRFQTGQVLFLPPDHVEVIVQMQLLTTGSQGSGGPYAFLLPYPAHRCAGSGNVDPTPIGNGHAYFSFVGPNVNVDVLPTLANPSTAVDDPDYWFQAYASNIIDWGTFTLPNSAASVTVNHKAGFAFNPEDLLLTAGNNSANAWHPPYVDGITSTQFVVHTRNNSTQPAANVAYSYKVRAQPPSGAAGALISPTVPWDWSRVTSLGPFGNFFFHLQYRARR
jgi:hypothetical protein